MCFFSFFYFFRKVHAFRIFVFPIFLVLYIFFRQKKKNFFWKKKRVYTYKNFVSFFFVSFCGLFIKPIFCIW